MLAEVDPELAQPSDRVRPLGNGRRELKAVIDAESRHGLEKLQTLLSHRDPHLNLGSLVARLVRDGVDRYDPTRVPRRRRTGSRGSVGGGTSPSASKTSNAGGETSTAKRVNEANDGCRAPAAMPGSRTGATLAMSTRREPNAPARRWRRYGPTANEPLRRRSSTTKPGAAAYRGLRRGTPVGTLLRRRSGMRKLVPVARLS
jgi:hypothetical protein